MDVAPLQPARLSDEEGAEIEEVTAFLGRIINNDDDDDEAINARIKIVNETMHKLGTLGLQ